MPKCLCTDPIPFLCELPRLSSRLKYHLHIRHSQIVFTIEFHKSLDHSSYINEFSYSTPHSLFLLQTVIFVIVTNHFQCAPIRAEMSFKDPLELFNIFCVHFIFHLWSHLKPMATLKGTRIPSNASECFPSPCSKSLGRISATILTTRSLYGFI